jgi:hypothetical protein
MHASYFARFAAPFALLANLLIGSTAIELGYFSGDCELTALCDDSATDD